MLKQDKALKQEIFKIITRNKTGVSWSDIKKELTGQAPQEQREIKNLEKKRNKKIKETDQLKTDLQQLEKTKRRQMGKSKRNIEKIKKLNQKIFLCKQEIIDIEQKIDTLRKRVTELELNPFCQKVPDSTLDNYLDDLMDEGLVTKIVEKSNRCSRPRFSLSSAELNKLYYEDKQREKKLKYELEKKEAEYNAPDNSYHKQLAQAMRKIREEMFGEKENAPTKEEIEKLKQELKKSQNNHSFDLTGYGGVKGIHNIKDRKKAKELFDRYLPILTRQLGYFVLLDIKRIAFSLESKVIIERLKKGDYWFDVRRDIAENFVSMLQKDFATPMSGIVNFVMELFANADVAFGNAVDNLNSSVSQFLEWFYENDEFHLERARLSQEVCEILSQQAVEGHTALEKREDTGGVVFRQVGSKVVSQKECVVGLEKTTEASVGVSKED